MFDPWDHMRLQFFSGVWNGDKMACLAILVQIWRDENTKEDHVELFSDCQQPLYQLSSTELHYGASNLQRDSTSLQLLFYWIWHRSAARTSTFDIALQTVVLFMALPEKNQSIIHFKCYDGMLKKDQDVIYQSSCYHYWNKLSEEKVKDWTGGMK